MLVEETETLHCSNLTTFFLVEILTKFFNLYVSLAIGFVTCSLKTAVI